MPQNFKLYKTVEWKEKSNSIQSRDEHQCQWCCRGYQNLEDGNFLVVHHKYYIHNLEPWNYRDDDVYVTLCLFCHKEWHKNLSAPIFNEVDFLIISGIYNEGKNEDISRPSFLIADSRDWVVFCANELAFQAKSQNAFESKAPTFDGYSDFYDVVVDAIYLKEAEK